MQGFKYLYHCLPTSQALGKEVVKKKYWITKIEPALCNVKLTSKVVVWESTYILADGNSVLARWKLSHKARQYLFSFKSYLFLLENKFTDREKTGRKIFLPLVHSPNEHNGQSWADSKAGDRSFFQVSNIWMPQK